MRLILDIIGYVALILFVVFSFILANRAMEANIEGDRIMGVTE